MLLFNEFPYSLRMSGELSQAIDPPPRRKPEWQYVPVYCLTKLSDFEKSSLERCITEEGDDINQTLDWVRPEFILWNDDEDGDLKTLYLKWCESGGGSGHHFAFYLDREAVQNKSLIIAQPDDYTMLYARDAQDWANMLFTRYMTDKYCLGDSRLPDIPEISDGEMELVDKDLLGGRGLNYGRVPAYGLRTVWANLDLSNMGMSELVNCLGRKDVPGEGKVEMIENEDWNEIAFLEKLERVAIEGQERREMDTTAL